MRSPLEGLGRLPSWQINAAGLAVCAALSAAWYFVGYSPLSAARADRVAVEHDLELKREDAARMVRLQNAYQGSLERIKAEAGESAVQLQPVEQLLTRISDYSRVAADAGLTLDGIKPDSPAVRERFTTVPVHLSGTGAFPGFAAFLHQLRTKYPDTGVVGMDLHGEPEHPDKSARFAIDLVWYALKAPEAPANTAQTDPGTKK